MKTKGCSKNLNIMNQTIKTFKILLENIRKDKKKLLNQKFK